MCGICGIFRRINASGLYDSQDKKAKDWFEKMLVYSQKRGEHSTGVAVGSRPYFKKGFSAYQKDKGDCGRVFMYKEATPADEFIKTENCKNILGKIGNHTTTILGHTRNASMATPKYNQNNHPHLCGSILGVHNGYISNWVELIKKFDLKPTGLCDSEVIFLLIDKFLKETHGLQIAIRKACGEIQGSYACAVVDTNKNCKVAVFRKDNPLYMRYRSASSALAFASEPSIIRKGFIDGNVDNVNRNLYIDYTELHLPNEHGYVFDLDDPSTANTSVAGDWVTKATAFRLK